MEQSDPKEYRAFFTERSGNQKTGPIPVTTTTEETCPTACPLSKNGCYADSGPLAIVWRDVTSGKRGMRWGELCERISILPSGSLWRHNQAGDLPGDRIRIDVLALRKLLEANRGKRGFTYTHYSPLVAENKAAISEAVESGFTVNLSGNSLKHADWLAELGIAPVVTLLPSDVDGAKTPTLKTPGGRTVTVCPATYCSDIVCMNCGICASSSPSRAVVGFPAHGTSKRKVNDLLSRD